MDDGEGSSCYGQWIWLYQFRWIKLMVNGPF